MPKVTNGASTGCIPNHVKIINEPKWKKSNHFIKLNFNPLILFFDKRGRAKIITIDKTNINTPPSFLGTERKIA